MENTVELLQWLHQQDQRGRQRVIHVLRSIIIYLKRKSDFVDTLLRSDDPQSMWQFHIHYSKESASPVARSVTITPAHSTTTLLENSQKIRPPSSQLSAPSRSTTPRSSSSYKVGEKRKLHISQPTQCYVHSMDSAVSYGFEYYSPGPQVVMTPAVESTVTAIIAGSTQHSVMCVSGEENTVRVSQAAQVQSMHYIQYVPLPLTILHNYYAVDGKASSSFHLLSSHQCWLPAPSPPHCSLQWACSLSSPDSQSTNLCPTQDPELHSHTTANSCLCLSSIL